MSLESTQVVVVGAGAAGLSAALRLRERGYDVALLEGRERVGGRIYTSFLAGKPPVELGAEFVHGDAEMLMRVIDDAELGTRDVAVRHWQREPLGVRELPDERWQRALAALAGEPRPNESGLELLERALAEGRLDAMSFIVALGFIEGFYAVDARRVAAHDLVTQQRAGERAHQDRLRYVPQGYARVPEWLAERFVSLGGRLLLGSTVYAVRWGKDGVEVRCAELQGERVWEARAVVLTLPVGVLETPPGELGAIRFEPPLPAWKLQAIDGLEMGPIVKVALRLAWPCWHDGLLEREADPRALGILHAWEAALPTFWAAGTRESPVLVGWAGGGQAGALLDVDGDTLRELAIDSAAAAFDADPDELAACIRGFETWSWQEDPYARGGYAFELRGSIGAREHLAQPIDELLFFAGEATDAADAGSVHGAIASGERAADEVTRTLERHKERARPPRGPSPQITP